MFFVRRFWAGLQGSDRTWRLVQGYYDTLEPYEVARRPRLWPINQPTWDAYSYVMTFADGWGGVSAQAVDSYLRDSEMDEAVATRVKRQVILLVIEARQIQQEKREAEKSKS